ncbi:hypothetical protein MP638_004514, partial [Amoeboaphelidium occidentale]
FLLDSGASENFMTSNIARAAGLIIESNGQGQAVLGNGSKTKILGTARSVTTKLGEIIDVNDFSVLEGSKDTVLLGMTWLAKVQPLVDWSKRSIDLSHFRSQQDNLDKQSNSTSPDASLSISSSVSISSTGSMGTKMKIADTQINSSDNFVEANIVLAQDHEVDELLRNDDNQFFLSFVCSSSEHKDQKITTDLSFSANQKLQRLLQEYKKVFKTEMSSLPPNGYYKHQIQLTSNAPVYKPPYRLSPREQEAAKSFIKNMAASGLIRESKSSYSSPILFVRKKDGTLRAVVDYRAINKLTVRDRYPVPRILDLLERLRSARIFSKMDWLNGFYQVRMAEDSIPYTAFSAMGKQWEFLVMPMGMCNSPSTFQRFTDSIFGQEFSSFLLVYFDDFLVFSNNEEDHIQHLEMVLKKLAANGFLMKASKCSFGKKEVVFVGHKISDGKRSIDPDKVKSITNFPAPTCASEVRQFHGLLRWVSDHIPKLSTTIEPLMKLVRKNVMFHWTDTEQKAFELMKEAVAKNIELTLPNLDQDFILMTDASDFGVGAVLMQLQGEEEVIIAFASKSLNSAERNYAVHDKEMLGIFWAVKHFRTYLEGRNTTVRTDHASLKYILTQPNLSRRQTRWLEFLGQFDLDIEYIKGSTNTLADLMSRNPLLKNITAIGPEGPDDAIRLSEDILNEDWAYLVIKAIQEGLETIPLEYRTFIEKEMRHFSYDSETHMLYRLTEKGKRAFLPFDLRADSVEKVHIGGGHANFKEVIRRMEEKVWWPYMARDIK